MTCSVVVPIVIQIQIRMATAEAAQNKAKIDYIKRYENIIWGSF